MKRVKQLIIMLVIIAFVSFNKNMVFAAEKQDSLFESSSTEFSLELAKFSLILSTAAYGDTCDPIEKVLASYGFVNDSHFDSNSYEKSSLSGTDLVGYSFASKNIHNNEKEYTLIAVVIRGTSGESEWISNFNINDSGSYPSIHEGFYKAEKDLLYNFNNYIKNLKVDPKTTKILITGHSRGAAVANILAADLSKTEKYADSSNIYGYTFATPNVGRELDNNYLNIFNAVNPADIVTEIPLKTWGYGKYGVNYSLTGKDSIDPKEMAATQKLLSLLTVKAPTVNDFYQAKLYFYLLKKDFTESATSNAHNPETYMNWLNHSNQHELSPFILDLQLKLLPDTNYA